MTPQDGATADDEKAGWRNHTDGGSLVIELTVNGIDLRFETHADLFSPRYPDRGTLAMLSIVDILPGDKVLDLGCGYGLVGVYAAKLTGPENVVLCDVDPVAVDYARRNAALNTAGDLRIQVSDGFTHIPDRDFSLILSNPPYHVDFSIPKRFVEGAFRHLLTNGRLALVVKRLNWYKNKIRSVFGGVRVTERDGYYVLEAKKRSSVESPGKRKKPKKKHLKRILRANRKRSKPGMAP